ncbi:MAG: hypothetical protein RML40_02400 [Bacteroidota bacterium]|nr:hypothetical protein [Candidatus Kapabacteria bacterium]MDW8219360.1 hypothetical protein [Bacteroidota bacterium]
MRTVSFFTFPLAAWRRMLLYSSTGIIAVSVSAVAQDCQSQLNRMTELVNKSARDIEALKKENAEYERTVGRMRKTISDRDKQIDSLTSDLAARKADITLLNNTVNSLNMTLAQRRIELQQRDSMLAARGAEIAALSKTLQERNDTLQVLRTALGAAQYDIMIKNEYITSLKADIEAKRKEISMQNELLTSISKDTVQQLRREIEALKKELISIKSDSTKPSPSMQSKASEAKK